MCLFCLYKKCLFMLVNVPFKKKKKSVLEEVFFKCVIDVQNTEKDTSRSEEHDEHQGTVSH